MNTLEFSNEFDTMLSVLGIVNNLDEYQKSVLLTQAQEDIVLTFYNGNNTLGNSFELTEEMRRYLDNLVRTEEISTAYEGDLAKPVTDYSTLYRLPDNLWFITYEKAVPKKGDTCTDNRNLNVIPATQDELQKLMNNPFRGLSYKNVLRLDAGNNIVELVSKSSIGTYTVRYLETLSPIVLVDLPANLSIKGIRRKTECVLHNSIHYIILKRAVELASLQYRRQQQVQQQSQNNNSES